VTTDTSERGLESLICIGFTGTDCARRSADAATIAADSTASYGGTGWLCGDPGDYDRDHAVDLVKLLGFLQKTQPEVVEQFGLIEDGPPRQKFLARMQGEIAKRGIIDVLRKGIHHGPVHVVLFYGSPTPGNVRAQELYEANVFSVTRQLRYPATPLQQ